MVLFSMHTSYTKYPFFSVETRQKSDSTNSNVILMGSYSLILIAVILTLQLICVAVDVISVTTEAGNHI